MGRIEDLAEKFGTYLTVPPSGIGLAAERVLMVVYDKELERTFRERMGEFEMRTTTAGRKWKQLDCTGIFSEWMKQVDYCDSYFAEPKHLGPKIEGEFKKVVVDRLRAALQGMDAHSVLAVTGVASLYGFARLSEIIRDVDGDIRGCLAIFFPGTNDKSNYRLLDARDGWNYLAHCISLHSEGAN